MLKVLRRKQTEEQTVEVKDASNVANKSDLNNIVDTSKNYYLKDYLKDKNTKFKMEYLEKAQKAMDATDGEIAGNV